MRRARFLELQVVRVWHPDAVEDTPAGGGVPDWKLMWSSKWQSQIDYFLVDAMYDSVVYTFSLWLIFATEEPLDMVLNTLAFEFFTQLDNEFVSTCLAHSPTVNLVVEAMNERTDNHWPRAAGDARGSLIFEIARMFLFLPLLWVVLFRAPFVAFIIMFYGPICK